MSSGKIILSDSTPTQAIGKSTVVDPSVLETQGLVWEKGQWRKPDGNEIVGKYYLPT